MKNTKVIIATKKIDFIIVTIIAIFFVVAVILLLLKNEKTNTPSIIDLAPEEKVIIFNDAYYSILSSEHGFNIPDFISNEDVGDTLEESDKYILYKCTNYTDGPLIIKYNKEERSYDYYVFSNFLEPPNNIRDILIRYGLFSVNEIEKVTINNFNFVSKSYEDFYNAMITSELFLDNSIYNQISNADKLIINIKLNNGVIISMIYYDEAKIFNIATAFYTISPDFSNLFTNE